MSKSTSSVPATETFSPAILYTLGALTCLAGYDSHGGGNHAYLYVGMFELGMGVGLSVAKYLTRHFAKVIDSQNALIIQLKAQSNCRAFVKTDL